MHSCTPEAIAYFFPCLSAFSLQSSPDPWDWFGGQLIFHLGQEGENDRFLRFCTPAQRCAVLSLLQHIASSRQGLIAENSVGNDLAECIRTWQSAVA